MCITITKHAVNESGVQQYDLRHDENFNECVGYAVFNVSRSDHPYSVTERMGNVLDLTELYIYPKYQNNGYAQELVRIVLEDVYNTDWGLSQVTMSGSPEMYETGEDISSYLQANPKNSIRAILHRKIKSSE